MCYNVKIEDGEQGKHIKLKVDLLKLKNYECKSI